MKWAGRKTQVLSRLEVAIPSEFDRYLEPFLGGGGIFFLIAYVRNMKIIAYLSDINKDLMRTYVVVKDNLKDLIELLIKASRRVKKISS
jgi:DNA adenine methylase